MWIRQIAIVVIGFASGGAIASAIFALIVKLGILTRLASWTKTTRDMKMYENFILLGGIAGNLVTLYDFPLRLGVLAQIIPGMFFGIYIGCFYMALAEALHAMPVLMRRINVKKGVGCILLCMALGKACGAFYYFWTNIGK